MEQVLDHPGAWMTGATAVRDLSWLESGALLHITYETEKDGTLAVDFVPDAELTDPGDLCGYPAE